MVSSAVLEIAEEWLHSVQSLQEADMHERKAGA